MIYSCRKVDSISHSFSNYHEIVLNDRFEFITNVETRFL